MKTMKPDVYTWRGSIALGIILLLLVLLLGFPHKVGAMITSPYIVDEKPQVHFGDSPEVIDGDKTYFGLENYTHEYVNGYLHMSYTYTHHFCCYDTHTPQVYITNVDPRSTSTPVVKSSLYVYPFSPGEPTDWYLIDIQFDDSGYIVSVKTRGISEIFTKHIAIERLIQDDWVALANNHPLGPDNVPVADSMSFTPLMYKTDGTSPPRNPVIIVPGIMGSYLNKEDGTEVWMNLLKMGLPGDDSYLNDLILNSEGGSLNNFQINPSGIITSINVPLFRRHIFDELISKFVDSGYIEGKDLFVFPYDWRLDLSQTSLKIKAKINEIKLQTGAEKVDIVAHSMGGLLVKKYLKDNENSSVEKFVDISTPHLGAPKSFITLMYGDTDISILNKNTIKNLSQNMPSIYELLPSQNYFDSTNKDYTYYVWNGTYQNNRLTFNETKDYLKNAGRNSILIDNAIVFHQEIDDLNPADYEVKTYNIVGCGTPTIGQLYLLSKKSDGSFEYNIKMINGDGTVPLKSAEAIQSLKTYFAKGGIHATMPSASGIKELAVAILTNDHDPDISSFSNLTTRESDCPKLNGRLVSFHSPIDLHIYDQAGNHVGPNVNGDIEESIPGVYYEIIDGNKFAYLPEGEDYIIKGDATDSGTFNARIETIQNETIIETRYFNEVPITNSTEVVVNQESISIDDNGDGIFEKEILVSAVLDENQSQDLTKPVTSITLTGNKQKDGTFSSSVNIKLSAIDDNSGVLKTEYTLNDSFKWNLYSIPFAVNTKGSNKFMYRSTDRAGNVEMPKVMTINVSKK